MLERWTKVIQDIPLRIDHRPEVDMVVRDALSRDILSKPKFQHCREVISDAEEHCSLDKAPDWSMPATEEFKAETARLHGAILEAPVNEAKWVFDEDGVLSRPINGKTKCFVPSSLRSRVFWQSHGVVSAGHYGIFTTFLRLWARSFWPGMTNDVKIHVKKCIIWGVINISRPRR